MKRVVLTASAGDWNLGIGDVKDIARQAGGEFYHGSGPDGAIVSGADRVEVEVLGKFGSDAHHAILNRLVADDERASFITWNPYVGQNPADVREGLMTMIGRHQPDVFLLQEAYRLRPMLASIPGYRRHQGPNVGENADCAILIRRRHATVNDGTLRMHQTWIGPKHGKRKQPRRYPFDRIQIADTRLTLRVLDVHLPTGGFDGRNAAAVRESARRIPRWHDTRGEVK